VRGLVVIAAVVCGGACAAAAVRRRQQHGVIITKRQQANSGLFFFMAAVNSSRQNPQPPTQTPGLAASDDGALCVSISRDGTVKVFDVLTFDMIVMMKLPYVPGVAEWVIKVRGGWGRGWGRGGGLAEASVVDL